MLQLKFNGTLTLFTHHVKTMDCFDNDYKTGAIHSLTQRHRDPYKALLIQEASRL